MTKSYEDALRVLSKFYGFSDFRPGQWEIIHNTLLGHDSVVLMPTGGGKSICYQIPALLLDGCALVISPLIALMNDQVTALNLTGIPAAAAHSNQNETVNRNILNRAAKGDLKILYISPERMMVDLEAILTHIPVSMIAVDEAHCISQWGHDFRPVYTQLNTLKQRLPDVPIMALTATADRLCRNDIAEALSLSDPFFWVGSFDRPNISLSVVNDPGRKSRLAVIQSFVSKYSQDAGIVYCLSRKKTEDMHNALQKMGINSVCYHAGLSAAQRDEAQRLFLNGDVQVVCATVAFGMGIDKSNIRWVIHNNIPGNIESYYQEIGRAGRDGLPAEALLFYNYGDVITRRSFAESSGMPEVNSEKLDFMQRYAEAGVCRRRILLSYFSQESNHDCGNCDNCRNPRKLFDGTILAQKALSAVIRINNDEAINTVIDILRASNRADILKKGYDKIKTYGAGRDLGSRQWHSYILQMIQLGLFEVAYEDSFHLRPTPLGIKVVKGFERVTLCQYEEFNYGAPKKKELQQNLFTPQEQLMVRLKEVRKELADKENVPAFRVFSDATLADMVNKLPQNLDEFLNVSGVGELRCAKYGRPFVSALRKFKTGKATMPVGTSQKETLLLFLADKTPEEIAVLKNINISTVYNHLSEWALSGETIDFRRLLSLTDFLAIKKLFESDPDNAYQRLKEEGRFKPYQINIAKTEITVNGFRVV